MIPGERSLDQLREGERGRVTHLASPESPDSMRLMSMGFFPGAWVRVDQRFPAVVVAVEDTVIAMESSLARGIFVEVG